MQQKHIEIAGIGYAMLFQQFLTRWVGVEKVKIYRRRAKMAFFKFGPVTRDFID